jgi:hypothetical protein
MLDLQTLDEDQATKLQRRQLHVGDTTRGGNYNEHARRMRTF